MNSHVRSASSPSSGLALKFKFGFGLLASIVLSPITWGQPAVSVTTAAPGGSMMAGQTVTMAVSSTTSGVTYQWQMNGTNIPGATGASYTMMAVGAADNGNYAVVATAGGSSVTVPMGTMTVARSDARLINLSARGMAGTGTSQMIMGFVSEGDTSGASQSVLLRGMGPSLGAMMGGSGMMSGSSTTLSNPVLTVYDSASRMMGSDMGWTNSPVPASGTGTSTVSAMMSAPTMGMMSALGAFAPTGTSDSAVMMTAPAGLYTTVVGGAANATGLVLAECYDADAAAGAGSTARLINMSARANVGTGFNVLIGGFVVQAGPSGADATVLIRAMGPTLAGMGVSGALTNPTMTLYDGNSKPIATSTAWTMAPTLATGNSASPVHAGIEQAMMMTMTQVGAFPPAAGAADSAMVVTLPPGNYSVIVSGMPDSTGTPMTGIALLEMYQVR